MLTLYVLYVYNESAFYNMILNNVITTTGTKGAATTYKSIWSSKVAFEQHLLLSFLSSSSLMPVTLQHEHATANSRVSLLIRNMMGFGASVLGRLQRVNIWSLSTDDFALYTTTQIRYVLYGIRQRILINRRYYSILDTQSACQRIIKLSSFRTVKNQLFKR